MKISVFRLYLVKTLYSQGFRIWYTKLRTEQEHLCDHTYPFLGEDDSAQELVLKSFHCDSEVNDGGTSTDFRSVSWVRELGGHIKSEALHHINLFVTNFHLKTKGNTFTNCLCWSICAYIQRHYCREVMIRDRNINKATNLKCLHQ